MNDVSGDAAIHTKPGELLRLVAEGLAAHGLDVRPPEHDDGCRMVIACSGSRCALSVTDWGEVEWQCWPRAGRRADPKQTADMATVLLTGRAQNYPRLGNGYGNGTVTFKGMVGLELKARGFDVNLEVYEDADYFDVHAAIVAASPGSGDDGSVLVTDDGSVTWTRDYWIGAAIVAGGPGDCDWIADPGGVADDVVTTVIGAMSHIPPASAVP